MLVVSSSSSSSFSMCWAVCATVYVCVCVCEFVSMYKHSGYRLFIYQRSVYCMWTFLSVCILVCLCLLFVPFFSRFWFLLLLLSLFFPQYLLMLSWMWKFNACVQLCIYACVWLYAVTVRLWCVSLSALIYVFCMNWWWKVYKPCGRQSNFTKVERPLKIRQHRAASPNWITHGFFGGSYHTFNRSMREICFSMLFVCYHFNPHRLLLYCSCNWTGVALRTLEIIVCIFGEFNRRGGFFLSFPLPSIKKLTEGICVESRKSVICRHVVKWEISCKSCRSSITWRNWDTQVSFFFVRKGVVVLNYSCSLNFDRPWKSSRVCPLKLGFERRHSIRKGDKMLIWKRRGEI